MFRLVYFVTRLVSVLQSTVQCVFIVKLVLIFYVMFAAVIYVCNQCGEVLSVSVREHRPISETAGTMFKKSCLLIPCDRGSVLLWWRCAALCILPVLWITPRLAVMGRMALGAITGRRV